MTKKFYKDGSDFRPIAVGYGSCIATDRITVDGLAVGYMYREQPENKYDSGWRFFAGDESDEYANNPGNLEIYDVNTIANYDPAITEFLEAPAGSCFVRENEAFIADE